MAQQNDIVGYARAPISLTGRYYDGDTERLTAAVEWCRSDDADGSFKVTYAGTRAAFWFTDEATAFAFKLRFL